MWPKVASGSYFVNSGRTDEISLSMCARSSFRSIRPLNSRQTAGPIGGTLYEQETEDFAGGVRREGGLSGAEDTSLSRAHRVAAGNTLAATGAPPRRRLFRKYALLVIALVGTALLINSGFDFWFSYQENKAGLIRIQQEKAEAAARRIEEAIGEYERQIGWTTQPQLGAPAAAMYQRRVDYLRLLRQVLAIT
jgi:hypothetical protein